MKWGIVADIHANKYALQAVLREFKNRGVKRLAVLGDIVGGGPHPEEVIKMVRNNANICVIGDHDLHVLGRTSRKMASLDLNNNLQTTQESLSKESLDWLGKRPRVSYWREHLFVHATPFNCFYGDILKASVTMKNKLAYGVAFCGHAHKPMFIRDGKENQIEDEVKLRPKDIVVVGSVGWPDDGPSSKAHVAIWDVSQNTVQYLQVEYDINSFLLEAQEYGFSHFDQPDM